MNDALRAGLQIAAFPLLFGGAGWLAWLAYTPAAAGWLMPALVAAAGVLAFALERLLPFHADWNRGPGTASDFAYLGLSQIAVLAAEALAWVGVTALAGSVSGLSWWPVGWPPGVQIALALALGDLLPYLYHRLSHETSGFLWRVHAVHHAPTRLYSLNFARFHPLNAALTAGLTLLPLAVLGAPPAVLFVAGVLHNVHGVLSHANVDFRLGPLNRVFSMAELHRWHHARDLRHAHGNYGATVTLWDWCFGTRRAPGRQVGVDEVGLSAASAGTVPAGLLAQLWLPFRGWKAWRPRWRCCGRSTA